MTAQETPAPKRNLLTILLILGIVGFFGIAFCGVLAAIAIPSYISYIRRSKASEASMNLRTLFVGAASYYQMDRGIDATGQTVGHCTVAAAGPIPKTPGQNKQSVSFDDASFRALQFSSVEPLYYSYSIDGSVDACNGQPARPLYTFRALGDLDGDFTLSTYELSVGVDEQHEVYRAPGFFIVNELE